MRSGLNNSGNEMNPEEHELKNIVIRKSDGQITVAKCREHVVDGIVTGTIVNVLAFPLLFVGIAVGLWMISLAIIGNIPRLLMLMGLMFVACSAVPLYLLLWSQPAFFPYECRFRRNSEGKWCLQRRLGVLTSPWRILDDFVIVSRPTYSRGDWGYDLLLKSDKATIMITPPGVFTPSKAKAREVAERDSRTVAECLGVRNFLEKWDKKRPTF